MRPFRLGLSRAFLLLASMLVLVSVAVWSFAQTPSIREEGAGAEDTTGVNVPEGYTAEMVAGPELVDYPMFATVDQNGRLFVFESTGNVYETTDEALENPQFRIKLLEDEDGDGVYDKSTIFADSLSFPQGGVFHKGSLYASSAPDLLKLTDTDGDGVADERKVLLSGWTLNINANSMIGPFMGPDGWLYMTSSIEGFDITTKEGEQLTGETARIWRVRPDGSDLEWVSAGGMNNPVELTFTEAGEPIGTETYFTDPKAGQRDALVYWTEGGVYPKPNRNIARDGLVRTGDLMPVVSKFSRVAPSGIGRYRSTVLGDDFEDNLFSAQFNTHRVLRHKVFRDSGSFRTEDEVFFSADDEDFHPTDVLEDADGSLLVVETGGWFIEGCPLSQTAKPEVGGGIYRVRREDAEAVEDPYGKEISWDSLASTRVAGYLEDSRPFVRDRAVQTLVDRGGDAVNALAELMRTSSAAEARTRAVFALYRIGTADALASVRRGLADPEPQVRVAAARSVGLARDTQAVARLMEMVRTDDPAPRRQAATALGRIGEAEAVSALLTAAADADDRFVEHAVTYALIRIDRPDLVEPGLEHRSPDVRVAALVALDQMPGSPLEPGQLLPLLGSENETEQQKALWVASHHPEWADEISTFLETRFEDGALGRKERGLFGDVLVSFCGDAGIQRFMAEQMKGASQKRKLFLLDTMAECEVETFPEIWVEHLGQQLTASNDPEVLSRTIELVRLRGITGLADRLRRVANEPSRAPEVRIQAIGALLVAQPQLTETHFAILYEHLQAEKEAPLRQQAASVLEKAELSEEQLRKLATEYLPKADAFILPRIVPVFQGAYSPEIGKALASALLSSSSLDSFTEEKIREIFAEYPASVQPAVDSVLSKLQAARSERLDRLQALEERIPEGDIERGRELFFGKATCSSCHTIGSQGGTFGPDLTSIQKDRSVHDLLEAIVYPSVSFVPEYETYRVTTETDEHTGIIQERTSEALLLGTGPQTSVRIPREKIVSTEVADVSMMPQSLDRLLTEEEMADLMAFLLGQDQDPESDEAFLR